MFTATFNRDHLCQQQQQQQPLPVVDIHCRHVTPSIMSRAIVSRGLVARASFVVLFVFGVAFVVASVADLNQSSRFDDDHGWLLPRPEVLISTHRSRRSASQRSVDGAATTDLLRHVTVNEVRHSLSEWSDCRRVMSAMVNATYLTSGWTKAVYVGQEHDNGSASFPWRQVAVKMVDVVGRDVRQCIRNQQSGDDVTITEQLDTDHCQRVVERKLLKEAYVLRLLENDQIVKLLSVCVPPSDVRVADRTASTNNDVGHNDRLPFVTMVTELGTGVDIIRLLQMSWEERLKITYDLTKLLHYLAHTEFGSIALNDFRRQQFIVVDRNQGNQGTTAQSRDVRDNDVNDVQLKLVDVDDVTFDEMTCAVDNDCVEQLQDDVTIRVACSRGRCEGLNEMRNVANAGRHFIAFLLTPGTPPSLRPLVDAIVNGYSGATLRIDELLVLVLQLVRDYSNGSYLGRETTLQTELPVHYLAMTGSDLPGLHDYRCRYTIARSSCTVTVHDQVEAEQLCDFDPLCRAFVLSNRTSWTGRRYAHLKNGVSSPTPSHDSSLYVRPL